MFITASALAVAASSSPARGQDMMGESAEPPPATRPAAPAALATALLALPAVPEGSAAPDISATGLDGKAVTLATLPRKPVVIVFGSYSCPSFRQRLPLLVDLARGYQKRVHFLILYTREAHAVGEWEVQRNKDEQIEVTQPADLPARQALAERATRSLGKDFSVAVDSMADQTLRAYGLFPNGCVVLDKNRRVVAVQKWLDPSGLGELIARANK
jgi:hypothetical protein